MLFLPFIPAPRHVDYTYEIHINNHHYDKIIPHHYSPIRERRRRRRAAWPKMNYAYAQRSPPNQRAQSLREEPSWSLILNKYMHYWQNCPRPHSSPPAFSREVFLVQPNCKVVILWIPLSVQCRKKKPARPKRMTHTNVGPSFPLAQGLDQAMRWTTRTTVMTIMMTTNHQHNQAAAEATAAATRSAIATIMHLQKLHKITNYKWRGLRLAFGSAAAASAAQRQRRRAWVEWDTSCNDNKYRQNVNNKPICDLLKLIGMVGI